MPGCTVASDGTLLDESQIDFYNDPDDDVPISGPHHAPSTSSSVSSMCSSTLDAFFTSREPAAVIAGVRRTSHTSKPSARARDTTNALLAPSTHQKRKAEGVAKPRHVTRKVVQDSDGSAELSDSEDRSGFAKASDNEDTDAAYDDAGEDAGEATDVGDDDAITAYEMTRAMGDHDREVSLPVHD
jgi:hypothetical protein